MTGVTKLNPDSAVLQQVDGYWQKLAALILWKTVGAGHVVKVTAADIEAMGAHFTPGEATILTHGHVDSIDFSLVSSERAAAIAAHDAAMHGHG